MPSHDEDTALLLRIAQRDGEAYRLLVNKYLSTCVHFAERMLGNRQDAEDIAQETCLKIWNRPADWENRARFSTWLYRVVFNACIDHKRRHVTVVELDFDALHDRSRLADDVLIEREQSEVVRNLLQQLPDRQRVALVLCYYEEVSNRHAAEIMGINVGALQQLLFRARQNLKTLLSETASERSDDKG